jgi:hypothetical protein
MTFNSTCHIWEVSNTNQVGSMLKYDECKFSTHQILLSFNNGTVISDEDIVVVKTKSRFHSDCRKQTNRHRTVKKKVARLRRLWWLFF